MSKIVKQLNCNHCNTTGTVQLIKTVRGNNITVTVKKCTNCKKQYGIKEILKINIDEQT